MGRVPEEFALISRLADTKFTFDDLLKYAKELAKSTANDESKKTLGKYIDILEHMARTKSKQLKETNRIKKLIYSLRDQRGFEFFTTDDPTSPASKLLAVGKEAIPYLIDELENNELTRSVAPEISRNRRVISPLYVLKVGDCVCGILREITGKQLGDSWFIHAPQAKMSPKQVREEAKKWWDKQRQKGKRGGEGVRTRRLWLPTTNCCTTTWCGYATSGARPSGACSRPASRGWMSPGPRGASRPRSPRSTSGPSWD
jgi:hypothetical protein